MPKKTYFNITEIDRLLNKIDPETGHWNTFKKICSILIYEDGPNKGKHYDYRSMMEWKERHFKSERGPISHQRKHK